MATPTKTGDKPVKAKPVAAAKTAAKPAAKPATKAKPAAAKSTAKTVKPAAKPAAPKAAKPVAAKQPAAAKKPAPAKAKVKVLSPDQRRFYIEVAAYYIAERRGFNSDRQLGDWVEAEAEIDRLLREGVLNP
jgi:hypothetical protein